MTQTRPPRQRHPVRRAVAFVAAPWPDGDRHAEKDG